MRRKRRKIQKGEKKRSAYVRERDRATDMNIDRGAERQKNRQSEQ